MILIRKKILFSVNEPCVSYILLITNTTLCPWNKTSYQYIKLSIASGHDMQIYNSLGQLRQL